MLNSLEVEHFTVFRHAEFRFSSGLNVIVGKNGLGKTHLLKLPYAVMTVSAEAKKGDVQDPGKAFLQRRIAEKLIGVFRPDTLGRLTQRRQGRVRCQVSMKFSDHRADVVFNYATQNRSEVVLDQSPSVWLERMPVFLPTRELLTIYPGFASLYDARYIEFEETWRDTCLLLGSPTLRGPYENRAARLLKPIEEQLGGRLILEQNGRFYLNSPGAGNMEMPLVAEGWRKLAMLARLIATGSLLDQGCLFWDEPEANLNPQLIRATAKAILHMCKEGVQVILATHSLFLLREFEILLQEEEFQVVTQRYFALEQGDNGVKVTQGDDVVDVDPLVLLDEELLQSDRFLDRVL